MVTLQKKSKSKLGMNRCIFLIRKNVTMYNKKNIFSYYSSSGTTWNLREKTTLMKYQMHNKLNVWMKAKFNFFIFTGGRFFFIFLRVLTIRWQLFQKCTFLLLNSVFIVVVSSIILLIFKHVGLVKTKNDSHTRALLFFHLKKFTRIDFPLYPLSILYIAVEKNQF
jgi:hypothetical protein